jgi:hypothetical protein
VVAAVWAMAVSSDMRRKLADLGVIPSILRAAARSLTLCRPGGAAGGDAPSDGSSLEAARDQLQVRLRGKTGVCVDSCALHPLHHGITLLAPPSSC